MDLKDLQGVANDCFNEHYTFTPKHPATNADLNFTATIRSMRSDEMVRLMNKMLRESQIKVAKEQRTGKVEAETIEQAAARDVQMACVLVVRFDGLKNKGEEIGDDGDKIKAVLEQHTWLRKQIMEEASEEQNFFKA